MDIWGSQQLEDGQVYLAQIGPLGIYLRRLADELHIAFERANEYQTGSRIREISTIQEYPNSVEWGRWIAGSDLEVVTLAPVMPDRPVVVRTELPLKIPTGQKALFFVSVPIWVRIVAGQAKLVTLCEATTVIRSNIWFGDTISGELCYSLLSRARRSADDFEIMPHRVICPVTIANNSPTMLEIERFCVHVAHLNIYQGVRQLWTNEVNIAFRGESAYSKVDYANKEPDFEQIQKVLGKARTPFKKTLLKASLSGFKKLSGLRED